MTAPIVRSLPHRGTNIAIGTAGELTIFDYEVRGKLVRPTKQQNGQDWGTTEGTNGWSDLNRELVSSADTLIKANASDEASFVLEVSPEIAAEFYANGVFGLFPLLTHVEGQDECGYYVDIKLQSKVNVAMPHEAAWQASGVTHIRISGKFEGMRLVSVPRVVSEPTGAS